MKNTSSVTTLVPPAALDAADVGSGLRIDAAQSHLSDVAPSGMVMALMPFRLRCQRGLLPLKVATMPSL